MPQKLRLWDKDVFGEEGRHVAAFIGEQFYDQTLLRLGGNARQAKKELNYRLDVGASYEYFFQNQRYRIGIRR